tara:strand:+ start:1792 stop:2562 length:771 start_codon:yes stop_codon:yes gene_type:complete
MTKHMLVPDAHAYPGDDFERFEMAGALALKERPDVIINIGDLADMESLSTYDVGKTGFEGRRYSKDIRAARDALDAFDKPINKYNLRQKKNKKPQYKPRRVLTLGNHEERINRAISCDAKLEGTFSIDDLGYKEHGWDVRPFLQAIEIDGIYYNHYFVSGVMGRPISGENPAKTICKKHMESCTAGHAHILDTACLTATGGRRVRGLVGGCFFEHHMPYAASTEYMWWKGLLIKHDVVDGNYNLQEFSMDRLRKVL